MPATAEDLLKLAQGRVQDSALAGAAVERVWAAVRSYCGWHVAPVRSETVVVDGDGCRILQVPSLRVVDVSEVREDGVRLERSAFMWSGDGSLKKRVGVWSREWRGVEVDLEHGFDDAADLDGVVLQVALRAVIAPAGQTRARVGQIDEQFGVSVSGFGFLASEVAVLESYAVRGTG